jgi:protein YibB
MVCCPMAIAIVTAFYDIGRSQWGQRPGVPGWLSRSVEDYFICFERLCRLDNELVVFTEEKFRDRILAARALHGKQSKTRVFCRDIFADYKAELDKISEIMRRADFLDGVKMPFCPEYWEPRYVLINYLKSFFACDAIDDGAIASDLVAWLDFGYCRSRFVLPWGMKWDYPFSDKIHLFNIRPLDGEDIVTIIKNNTVYFQGCHIVATRQKWRELKLLMRRSFDQLVSENLIDDDQTLLLMSYRLAPELFEAHFVDTTGIANWFVVMREYNTVRK